MLVILKIPVVYLCAVVWWAIKAEPRPLEGAGRSRGCSRHRSGRSRHATGRDAAAGVRPSGHSRAEGAPSSAAGW